RRSLPSASAGDRRGAGPGEARTSDGATMRARSHLREQNETELARLGSLGREEERVVRSPRHVIGDPPAPRTGYRLLNLTLVHIARMSASRATAPEQNQPIVWPGTIPVIRNLPSRYLGVSATMRKAGPICFFSTTLVPTFILM